MISVLLRQLGGRKVVLASASPRRIQILENIGFPCTVEPSKFAETLDKASFNSPAEYAVANAKGKALEVSQRLKLEYGEDWITIIGADTVVELDGTILEKPLDKKGAVEMLQKLNGRTHLVHTGVSLVRKMVNEVQQHCFHEQTSVTFGQLSDEIITAYVDSGELLDKAGAYGIQGLGGTLVKKIDGDYYNVVGLPLYRLCNELSDQLKLWTTSG